MSSLHRITIYPVKALEGHAIEAATVLPGGALAGDRRYALVDAWGCFVNGKRCEVLHRIRACYSDDLQYITLRCDGTEATYSLNQEKDAVAHWCGEILGISCKLVENVDHGFPDDSEASGPTLISTASLTAVAEWFDLPFDEARRRFRMNLEVDGTPPFWEDRLVPEFRKVCRFCVGSTVWQGRGICARCAVPTRDARDGEVSEGFAREFVRQREATLPEWSPTERFDHFYRLGVNTCLESIDRGNVIHIGDTVQPMEGARRGNSP